MPAEAGTWAYYDATSTIYERCRCRIYANILTCRKIKDFVCKELRGGQI